MSKSKNNEDFGEIKLNYLIKIFKQYSPVGSLNVVFQGSNFP